MESIGCLNECTDKPNKQIVGQPLRFRAPAVEHNAHDSNMIRTNKLFRSPACLMMSNCQSYRLADLNIRRVLIANIKWDTVPGTDYFGSLFSLKSFQDKIGTHRV